MQLMRLVEQKRVSTIYVTGHEMRNVHTKARKARATTYIALDNTKRTNKSLVWAF